MPFSSPEEAATAAMISLLLEVSGNPKAGNVDREHDFQDLKYEHFLISAASSYSALVQIAKDGEIGRGIFKAVETSIRWHKAGNVHFGAFLLLAPLLSAWKGNDMSEVVETATENLKRTSYEDSLYVLKAFEMSDARVLNTGNFSLRDSSIGEVLKRKKVNLYEWMQKAPPENLIAKELTGGYGISLEGARFILNSQLDVNEVVVFLYHELLSKYPDPLVISKAGVDMAREVMILARKALESANPVREFRRLDEYLLARNLNPGTIADFVVSSLYLAISEGWRL
jgi:triphosphoribosyl-dephospho-CoA synthase